MISADVWERAWASLERAFEELAAKTKLSVYDLSWGSGHNANNVFPFRAYATFRSGSRVVDLSVDCKLSEGVLLISADLAREDGFVLSDIPVRTIHLTSNQAEVTSEIEAGLAQVERFAFQQVNVLSRELRLQ